MSTIFQQLTDLGLRRVYKFVLKQTIGKYLDNELLIDQLDVQSRDGRVKVHNLALDTKLLNEEIFNRTPVTLISLVVHDLEVIVSYGSLFTDGLQFDVGLLEGTFGPNPNYVAAGAFDEKADNLAGESDTVEDNVSYEPPGAGSEEGQNGMTFIAQWIEVIVAKLRVNVKEAKIRLLSETSNHASSDYIDLSLMGISFFNTDPQGIRANSNSLQSSKSILSSKESSTFHMLSAAKVIQISSISICVGRDSEQPTRLLEVMPSMAIKIKMGLPGDFDSPEIDVNVSIPTIKMAVHKSGIRSFFDVISIYLSVLNTQTPPNKISASTIPKTSVSTLKSVLRDLAELELEMEAKRQSMKPDKIGLTEHDSQAVDSDGEFPASDDSDNEDEFFDAVGFDSKHFIHEKKSTSSLTASRLLRAAPSATQRQRFRFSGYVGSTEVSLVDDTENVYVRSRLVLQLSDLVVSFDVKADDIDQSALNALKLSVNGLEVFEEPDGHRSSEEQLCLRNVLASFVKSRENSSIYSSPDLSVTVLMKPQKSDNSTSTSTEVTISLEFGSLVASGSIPRLTQWGKVASGLLSFDVPAEPTSSVIDFQLTIPSVEFYLHADHQIEDNVWVDINKALLLDLRPTNWSKLLSPQKSQLKKHLQGCKGGLYFISKALTVKVRSLAGSTPAADHRVEMDKISMGIFIDTSDGNSDQIFLKSKIISANADESGKEKIYIRKSISDLADSGHRSRDNFDSTTNDEMGPIPPLVHQSHILFVRAHSLTLDVEQREFHALLMIADTIVVKRDAEKLPSPARSPKANIDGDASFGLHVSSAFANLSFSENESDFYDSKYGFKNARSSDLMRLLEILHRVKADHSDTSARTAEQGAKLKLCVSIRDPMVELYSVQHQLFVGIKANDLSMYEMTPNEHKMLVEEGFNFHRPLDLFGVRIGDQKHRVPFIRRAFVPVDDSQAKLASSSFHRALLSDHSKYGNAFEVRLCLTHDEDRLKNIAAVKSVHFFIDFYDILLNHDPASTWLFKLVKIMTPQTALQMIESNFEDVFDALHTYRGQLSETDSAFIKSVQRLLSTGSTGPETLLASKFSDTGSRKIVMVPFEITKVSVRVRDSLLDFCHAGNDSRILLSVSLIAVSSTIVSNSDRVTLKLSLTGLTFYACNRIATGKRAKSTSGENTLATSSIVTSPQKISQQQVSERSKLRDWMNENDFVNLLDIDYLTNLVILNESERDPLSLKFTIGTCTIGGCFDSLLLFKDALSQWFKEFETSCAQSEKILRKKKKKTYDLQDELYGISLGDGREIDRIRFCDVNEKDNEVGPVAVKIPDSLLQSRMDLDAGTRAMEESLAKLNASDTIPMAIFEDYYGTEDDGAKSVDLSSSRFDYEWREQERDFKFDPENDDDAEASGRWEADYGYDNESQAQSNLSSSHMYAPGTTIRHDNGDKLYSQRYDDYMSVADSVLPDDFVSRSNILSEAEEVVSDSEAEDLSEVGSAYRFRDQRSKQPRGAGVTERDGGVPTSLGISRLFFGERTNNVTPPEDTELQSLGGIKDVDQFDRGTNLEISALEQSNLPLGSGADPTTVSARPQRSTFADPFDATDLDYYSKAFTGEFHVPSEEIPDEEAESIPPHPVVKPVGISTIPATQQARKVYSGGRKLQVVQPGLSAAEKQELEELEIAWEKIDGSLSSTSQDHTERGAGPTVASITKGGSIAIEELNYEQEARWYVDANSIDLKPHYIPIPIDSGDGDDHRTGEEKQFLTKVAVVLGGHFKLRLFAGQQWQKEIPISEGTEKGRRKSQGSRSVSFATASEEATKSSTKDVPLFSDKPSKSALSSKSSSAPKSDPSDANRMGEIQPINAEFIPLKERHALDVFMKHVSLQISMYDQSLKVSSVSIDANDDHNGAESSSVSGWKDFDATRDEDGQTVASVPIPQQDALTMAPAERITFSVKDFLISFGPCDVGRRKKVLGSWLSSSRPRDASQPMVRLTMLGYKDPTSSSATNGDVVNTPEYRVHFAALPLRCFLSDEVINFVRQIVEENTAKSPLSESGDATSAQGAEDRSKLESPPTVATTNVDVAAPAGEVYFQQVIIASTAVKIDYRASAVNLKALHQGDYLQLLNILPIDGLEISLKALKLNGIDGSMPLMNKILEFWVKDIYSNQLHRVISGAAPLKSLSHIGKDLQGLLYIPAAQIPRSTASQNAAGKSGASADQQPSHGRSSSSNNQNVMRHLQKSTKSLLSTITRETLDVSHKLTMFMAQTITDLATTETEPVSAARSSPSPSSSSSTVRNNGGRPSQQHQQSSRSNSHERSITPLQQQARRSMEENLIHQPRGLQEGLTMAYEAVTREFAVAADTVIAVPVRQYERLGPSGLITSVVRALPVAVLRPVAGIAEGISYTILGMRNGLDPDTRLDEEDLWNVDFPLP